MSPEEEEEEHQLPSIDSLRAMALARKKQPVHVDPAYSRDIYTGFEYFVNPNYQRSAQSKNIPKEGGI